MIPRGANQSSTRLRKGNWGLLRFIVILHAGCILAPAPAAADIIRGTVTDASGGAPLDLVKVMLEKNPSVCTYTNASGTYTINTDVAAVPGATKAAWNRTFLFTLLRGSGDGASVRIYNTRGALIWENRSAAGATDVRYLLSRLPAGMYAVSVKKGTAVAGFWLCNPGNGVFFMSDAPGAYAPPPAVSARADHTLQFVKKGYLTVKKTVSGSQDNVNCSMTKSDCGNGLVDPGEACDGDARPCNLISAMKYATGTGACNDVCTGYAQDSCVAHPVSDVSSNPNGADHRRAAEITGWAEYNVIQRLQPGMLEGDLHTIIDSVYKSMSGYSGYAFGTITGSGPNSTDLHYEGKTRKMQNGDVVVVDIGAKSNGWCGDITRTYPVGGKYTPRQREIYQLVLDAQKAAFAELKAKNQSLSSLDGFVQQFFRKSPLRAKDESGTEHTMEYFFIHGLSHFIGKTVHGTDLPYANSYGSTLKPGWLFSIEPGIYIKSEKFGVRIEDDFMMTANGPVNIFPNTPVEADHIEALMALRRLSPPPAHPQTATASDTGAARRSNHMDF